ncbi:MAG: hypothetical protein ACI8PZ_002712 [Myxococcota bacterium]|jgi:hypothetical protein
MRTLRSFVIALVLATAPLAPQAFAKGGDKPIPEIQETGISAFDTVFQQVKAIQDTLNGAETRLNGARDKIAIAVGQPPGTSVRMSMWELKQKAGGKVEVKMAGGKPQLSLGGAGGAEAQAGVKAANAAVKEVGLVVVELGKLPQQVAQLVNACKAFPSQVGSAIKEAGLAPTALPKMLKAVGTNVKATAATPKRIASLATTAKDLLAGIPEGIAATSPPTDEAVAAKKSEKKSGSSGGGDGDAPDTETTRLVTEAMAAFGDAEVDDAMRLLDKAQADLAGRKDPVSPSELQLLYQSRALVLLVQGDAAGATTGITRALSVDPDAKPLKSLGAEYAKLHKNLQKSGVVRPVAVSVAGSGEARISGRPATGGSSVELAHGQHLVQVKRGDGWVSKWVDVGSGTVIQL